MFEEEAKRVCRHAAFVFAYAKGGFEIDYIIFYLGGGDLAYNFGRIILRDESKFSNIISDTARGIIADLHGFDELGYLS
jgi:hypothetical protein